MDSVCSALAYARLKHALGWKDVVAARAGNLNERIEFVLGKFGVEPPVFLGDVTPQVRDVMTRGVVSLRADQSVAQALRSIEERRLRVLPVVDHAGRCLGLLSAITLLEQFFPPPSRMDTTRIVRAAVHDIVQTFDGLIVAGESDNTVQDYVLMVAAARTDTMVKRLREQAPGRVVLIVGDRDNIQTLAIDAGVRALIITGGMPVPREILAHAEKRGVTVVRSRHDTATTVLLARGAVRAGRVVERDFVSFEPELPLEAARARAASAPDFVFPCSTPNSGCSAC